MLNRVKLIGSSYYLPGEAIPFEEVDHYLGPLDAAPEKIGKWLHRIKSVMAGILEVKQYYFAIDPITRAFTEDNITMSVKAATKALQTAGITAEDIDFIAYGSAHQDQMPTASVRIQEALGIEQCGEVSIHANCTSAYKALTVAYDFLRIGRYKRALVISSSMASSELRTEYYNLAKIKKEDIFLRYFLSDGAAALILESTDKSRDEGLFLEHCHIESIGGNKPSAMGNQRPAYFMNPKDEYEQAYHHLSQVFNEKLRDLFHEPDGSVFVKGLKRMLENHPIDKSKIRHFQVNFPSKHIADLIMDECEEIGIPRHTLFTRMSSMGYIGPPMVFACMAEICQEGGLNQNDIILSFVTEVSKFMQAGFVCQYHGKT